MKRIRYVFIVFNLIFSIFLLISCTMKKSLEDIVSFNRASYTYDGLEHSIEAENLPSSVSVTYSNNTFIDAGRYNVIASFDGGKKYKDLELEATLTIFKAECKNIVFTDTLVEYDGKAHTIEAINPYDFISIDYTYYNEAGYKVEECRNAGDYTVCASFTTSNKNYVAPQAMTAILSIKAIAAESYTMDDKTFTYDGFSHTIAIKENLPSYLSVSYTYISGDDGSIVSSCIDAGDYLVCAKFTSNDSNYETPSDCYAVLKISKATLNPTMDNKTYIYDGLEKQISINEDLNDSFDVTYTYKDKLGNVLDSYPKNVGVYTVCATFKNKNGNYNEIKDIVATIEICEAKIDGISFNDKTFTYDGLEKSIYITGDLPDGVLVSYSGNNAINAGTYTVIATIEDSLGNYDTFIVTATITIEKANYDMSGVSLDGETLSYDGLNHELRIKGVLPDGVSVAYSYYKDNALVNAAISPATYNVIASFTGSSNYNLIDSLEATLIINKLDLNVTLLDSYLEYDEDNPVRTISIEGDLPSGVSVSYVYYLDDIAYSYASSVGIYEVVAVFSSNYSYYNLTSLHATLKLGYLISIDVNDDINTIEYTYIAIDVSDLVDYLEGLEPDIGEYLIDYYGCISSDDFETNLLVTDFDGTTEIYGLDEIYNGVVFASIYIPCVVQFDTLGNAKNAAILEKDVVTTKIGSIIDKPTIITNAYNEYGNYYSFVGWYTDKTYETLFDFSEKVMDSITIYSYWEIIEISTAEELVEYLSSSSKCNAYLSKDIDMTNNTLVRDNESYIDSFGQFAVTLSHAFYGNGHTISNLNIESSIAYSGIFGVLNGASIYDLIIDGATISSTTSRTGLIAGTSIGDVSVISGVVIKNTIVNTKSQFGLYVGKTQSDLNIYNSVITNVTINGKANIGGIIGHVSTSSNIVINKALIDLIIISSGNNSSFVIAQASSRSNLTISNIVVTGSISSSTATIIIGDGSSANSVLIENVIVVSLTLTMSSLSSVNVFYNTSEANASDIYYYNLNAYNNDEKISISDGEYKNKNDLKDIVLDGFEVVYNDGNIIYTLSNQSISI